MSFVRLGHLRTRLRLLFALCALVQASNGTVFLTDSLFRNNSGAQFGGAVLL